MKNVRKYVWIAGTFCLTALLGFGCSEEILKKFISDDRTIEGLKEALKIGAGNATKMLGAENGYLKDEAVKILLPENAQTTFNAVSAIASNDIVKAAVKALGVDVSDNLKNTLEVAFNQAAEKAAPAAKQVFVDAITGMTIQDGKDILFSGSNHYAATEYLEEKTYPNLLTAFDPIINESMKTVKVSINNENYDVLQAWAFFSEWNNKLTGVVKSSSVQTAIKTAQTFGFAKDKVDMINSVDSISPNLGNHVVGKALNGIFFKVGKEEEKIRTDASARVNDLLKDVFGQLDN